MSSDLTIIMNIYEEISRNNKRTLWVLLVFTITVMIIGFIASMIIIYNTDYVTASEAAAVTWQHFPIISGTILVIILVWTLFSFYFGDKMILRFTGAKPIERKTHFELYNIVEKMQESLDGAMEVAQQSDHPRAYEVVFAGAKHAADVVEKIGDLHKKMKDLEMDEVKVQATQNNTTNNVFMSGSTKDLMMMLKEQQKEQNK